MQQDDYYNILEVGQDAAPQAIEASYRRLSRAGGASALQEAYETLRDPERRARYDRERRLAAKAQPPASHSDEPTPVPPLVRWLLSLPILRRTPFARRPREFERFLKFAAVGAFGMMVDLTILYLMREYGLPPLMPNAEPALLLAVANTISFTVAVISNFTWNRLWTFPETRNRPLLPQLGQFALVNVAGWAINQGVLLGLWHLVFEARLPAPFDYLIAKVIAIGIVLFWNYGVNRLWTYRGIK